MMMPPASVALAPGRPGRRARAGPGPGRRRDSVTRDHSLMISEAARTQPGSAAAASQAALAVSLSDSVLVPAAAAGPPRRAGGPGARAPGNGTELAVTRSLSAPYRL